MNIIIRRAELSESHILTALAMSSNRYWDYPEEYHKVWDEALRMNSLRIKFTMVYVAEKDGEIVGYFSVVNVRDDLHRGGRFINKGYWFENLFIAPKYIAKGIGTLLITFAKASCKEEGATELNVFAEPLSKGFYEKVGGKLVRESATEFVGRVVPVYVLPIQHIDI